MDTSIIYMMVHNPTSHTYVTLNDDGTFREHHSLKRARLHKPDAKVLTYIMKEGN